MLSRSYCTYSGPHTGIREAIPAVKYMEQFFEHLRFNVLDEWYIVGEFKGNDALSANGALGDIRNRPDGNDLVTIGTNIRNLIIKIKSIKNPGPELHEEFIPDSIKFMARNQTFLENFKRLSNSQELTTSLNRNTQALLKIVLAASFKCRDCLKSHIIKALEEGMTDVKIKNALLSGAIIGGPPFLSFSFEIFVELGLM